MADLKYEPTRHDHAAFIKKARGRKGFSEAYEALAREYEVVGQLLKARTRAGLTQDAVAEGAPTADRQARAGGTPDIDAANQQELTREDQDRLHLRGLLLVGAATAPGDAADSEYFNKLRDRVRKASNAGSRR